MGIKTKFLLITEIIRIIKDGTVTLELITEQLTKRPLVMGSDIIALVPLARKFGFISGDDKNLTITKSGLDFMNYVDSASQEAITFGSPTEEDYTTLDKELGEISKKYKDQDRQKEVYKVIQDIRSIVAKYVNSAPEISADSDLLLTASMPPGTGEKIPLRLRGITLHHDEAIKKVLQDTTSELIISSPFLEVSVFKLLVGNTNTQRLRCKILTSDEDRLKNNSYNLTTLKSFLGDHFLQSEIRYLKKPGFISHAKMWLSEKSAHITSANILANSQTDNFELGVYTTNRYLIDSCKILIDKVWDLGEIL